MDPATGDIQIRSFFTKLVIDLIAIGYHGSGEILEEFSGMVGTSGGLPVIKNYWIP